MSLADPYVTAVAAETVVLATRNAAKLHELDRILAAEDPGGAQIRLAGLDQVTDVPDTRLGAQFVCAAALVRPGPAVREWVVTALTPFITGTSPAVAPGRGG